MAQTMLLTSSVSGHALDLKRQPLLERLKPKPFSNILLPSRPSSSSFHANTTIALFKSKAKAAPAKKVEKPKPKVEDGIFGTSGGIGFTKQNELFVGRLAQLGIVFSIIGEIITGKGALAQLNIETGVPIGDIEPLVLLNVAFFFFAALNPGTGKFITDEEEEK
ncbi:hypothetical protein CsSME_00014900 [Camellia sinensis var. sinensis]